MKVSVFRQTKPLDEYLKKKLTAASTPGQRYLAYTTFAITRFQLLEHELRVYLLLLTNRRKLPISDHQLLNWPLKTLNDQFRKYGGDRVLVDRIGKLIPARNFVAHEGFIDAGEDFGLFTPSMIKVKLGRMERIAADVEGMPYLVSQEAAKVMAASIHLRAKPIDEDDGATTGHASIQ